MTFQVLAELNLWTLMFWIQTFWRNIVPQSLALRMKTGCFYVTLVPVYKSTRYRNAKEQQWKILIGFYNPLKVQWFKFFYTSCLSREKRILTFLFSKTQNISQRTDFTPWSRVLFVKLRVAYLTKKFLALYKTLSLIKVFVPVLRQINAIRKPSTFFLWDVLLL